MTTKTRRTMQGGTFNVLRREPGERQALAEDLGRYLKTHPLDFLALQEIRGHHDALRTIAGYDLVAFSSAADGGDNGILVRRGVPHGAGLSADVTAYWFTRRGKRFPARSIVSVGLGDWLRVTTVHAPVQVLNHSSRFAGAARRIAAYKRTTKQLLGHIRRVRKRTPDVGLVIVGDWNADRSTVGTGTPGWLARQGGMKTRAGGHIDWPMYRGCELGAVQVDRHPHNLGSDHPIVRFTVTEARR